MGKKIFITLAVIIAVLVVVISLRPSDFIVTRSTVIAAPAEVIFNQVNDLHKWTAWSAWGKEDPNMEQTFEGAPAGFGASYHWAGNAQVGEGRMTITQSDPNEHIKLNLEFIKPFKGTNDVEFLFEAKGAQTVVTWTMSGKNNFVSKAMGLIMDCDKIIGDKYDEGLANLKRISEAPAPVTP